VLQKSKQEKNEDVLIIAMTANTSKNDIDNCLESGMNNFISKPYKIDEIKSMLSRYFDK